MLKVLLGWYLRLVGWLFGLLGIHFTTPAFIKKEKPKAAEPSASTMGRFFMKDFFGLAPSNASVSGGSKARTPVAAPQWELVGLRVRGRVRVGVRVGVRVRDMLTTSGLEP